MAVVGAGGVIAVATSIPPFLARQDAGRDAREYQKFCIQSWIGNGFRVISVNHAEEIPALAQRYPEVTFIATNRDAREWTGRKNPYIADLLLALQQAKEPVLGLINSDLVFEPTAAWAENLPSRVGTSMVVAHRYNTHSLQRGVLRRFQGLDCFFFDRSIALRALESAWPFAIGAPWWDYWLPCIALLNDRTVTVVDRPVILHLFHKTAYSRDSQKEFGFHFANVLLRESKRGRHGELEAFSAVMPMLQEIAARSLDDVAIKRQFSLICERFIREIRKSVEVWSSFCSLPSGGGVSNAFEQIDQRLLAGDAFQKAKTLLTSRPPLNVGPELIAILSQAPADPDVQLILGEISMRDGDFDAAHSFFVEAGELLPNAPGPLHSQGTALRSAGRNEAAMSCFRRALEIAPDHQPSCIAIAKGLWEAGQRREAMDFLNDAIARRPDAARVAKLRDTYRRLTNM